ncbi:alkaline phosphatase D [Colletotrichum spaethianum]|uniref:Alkaline phosphatase D n=1 Tax=Colletotrichum spaethianum TaxID=700344 RepID=A0AA37P9N5_9PEZI|nr:alkaline phosphatase D [Colletotrichum spaethianum]GKT48207.1 alkaline phosphatase D [Colletotrichum spaethianum]
MVQPILAGLALAATASAAFSGNLNYFSPSKHHASLGVSINKVAKRTYANSHWDAAKLNFTHGVASGDPYEDSVILWTRAAPTADNDKSNVTVSGYVPLYDHSTEEYVQKSDSPVCVDWKISTSKTLEPAVDSGTVYTSSDVDYTVKVEAKKLAPYTVYYYQFSICNSNNTSPIGRTKTIPTKDGKVDTPVKLAVYSCSNYPFGFFNAYGNPVRKDSVDYVIHLGDYIYEYGNGEYGWGNSLGRIPLPDRQIYTSVIFFFRIMSGIDQITGLPIRQVDMDDNLRIWREFSFGSLFDLVMLDTRQYDRAITDVYTNTDYVHAISNDASRSLMGPRQEAWFYKTLKESSSRGATWRVIGNQIVFSRMNESASLGDANPLNYDSWDGYQANRNRTFQVLYEQNVSNTIFLAGDSHASWVSDLVWLGEHEYDQNTGSGSVGVEFAGSAVSSPCPAGQNISLANANAGSAWLTGANRELQWQDLFYRGYYELSIDYDAVNASFFGIPTTRVKQGYEISLANFTVLAGENKLHRWNNGSVVPGGVAESGSLKNGKVVQTNLTLDTATGEYLKYNSP